MFRHRLFLMAALVLAGACAADRATGTAAPTQATNAWPAVDANTILVGILHYDGEFYSLLLDDGSVYALDNTPVGMADLVDRRVWVELRYGEIVQWAPADGGPPGPKAPLFRRAGSLRIQ